jgi:uncharacterized alpha-E superfamily protein
MPDEDPNVLSRIASSLYWMSRYLERVDNTASIIDRHLMHRLEEDEVQPEAVRWRPLLAITESEETFAEVQSGRPVSAEAVVRFMTQDDSNPGSIHASLRLARENARGVRDRISNDMWECVNELWLGVDRFLERPLNLGQAHEFYQHLRREVARFHGVTVNTMLRGESFAFHLLGTFIERSDMTARILDVKYHLLLPDPSMVGSPLDYYQWGVLLNTLSGFDAYRRKYHGGLRPIDVAGFVVFDAEFPRSLAFSFNHIRTAHGMTGAIPDSGATHDALQALHGMLSKQRAQTLIESGLHEYLEDYIGRVADIHEAIAEDFFEPYIGEELCVT